MARKPVTKIAKAADKVVKPRNAVSGAVSAPQFDRLMKPLKPSRSLGLAVSGGGDSVALMLLVSLWRDWLSAKGRPVPAVTVLTVDHGLRKEAAREAQQVGRWAKALGLAHKIFKWKPGHLTSNVQQAARDARYGLLTDWAAQSDADLVVAHHLDDQAETFLMRLQRGSGVDGLAAMAPTSMKAGVRVLRPLLDVPRDALRATLVAHNHAWIDDPSNEDERFLRVQVRKALPVLSDFGLSRERLVETAAHMARARAALEIACDRAERAAVTWHDEGFARLLLSSFRALPDEIALRLLVRIMKGVTGSVYGPRLQALEGLRDALCQLALGGGRTLGGAKWMAVDGSGETLAEVLVMREVAALSPEPLSLKAGTNALWDGRFRVTRPKGLRAGEVRPLGAEGLKLALDPGAPHRGNLPHKVPKQVLHVLPAYWRGADLVAQPQIGFLAPECEVAFEAVFVGGRR